MTTVLQETHRQGPAAAQFSEHTLGRRDAIRKWFHNLYREKPDAEFDGDECISLEEAESLVMIPSFHLLSGQTTAESPKSTCSEKKQVHSHRDKIRDLKIHLKVKLSQFKHRHGRSEVGKSANEKDTKRGIESDTNNTKIDNTDTKNNTKTETESNTKVNTKKDSNKNEVTKCSVQDLFIQQPIEKVESTDEDSKSSDADVSPSTPASVQKQINECDDPCQERTSGHESPVVVTVDASTQTNEGSCRLKRQSNDDDADAASIKRPCASRETGSASSNENSEGGSTDISQDRRSIEEASPSFLGISPINLEVAPEQPVEASECAEATADSSIEPEEDVSESMESSDDFSASEDTSFSDECSTTGAVEVAPDPEPCVLPVEVEKYYTIPTFRKRVRTLNVANIVKSFREGTLNEEKLAEIANKGVDGHGDLTFKNKAFYDDISAEKSNVDINDKKVDKECSQTQHSKSERNSKVKGEKSGGTVKFDKFSHLVVYETVVNPSSTTKGTASIRDCETTLRLNKTVRSPTQGQKVSGTKSILKVKSNRRAKEENMRATACDRVAVDSFMDLFEHYENKKQMEECKLAEEREDQLNNYFSEHFFPEILKDKTITTSANSEFSRSRKATETNIGRKLGAVKCGTVRYYS